jgi:hypothetical protein
MILIKFLDLGEHDVEDVRDPVSRFVAPSGINVLPSKLSSKSVFADTASPLYVFSSYGSQETATLVLKGRL